MNLYDILLILYFLTVLPMLVFVHLRPNSGWWVNHVEPAHTFNGIWVRWGRFYGLWMIWVAGALIAHSLARPGNLFN